MVLNLLLLFDILSLGTGLAFSVPWGRWLWDPEDGQVEETEALGSRLGGFEGGVLLGLESVQQFWAGKSAPDPDSEEGGRALQPKNEGLEPAYSLPQSSRNSSPGPA